jgi:hypothetical protein
VVVITDPKPMPVLSDALIRVRGELSAAGLQAELRERKSSDPSEYKPDPGVYGVLAFEQLGPVILIHAFGPAAHTPITESVDTQSSAVNAEVLAVRAVETLRAAMVQEASNEASDLPEAVRNFTHAAAEPEAKPAPSEPATTKRSEPERPPPKAPAPIAKPRARPARSAVEHRLIGWLGAGLSLEPNARAYPSGQLGVLGGPSWGFVSASLESSLTRLELAAAAGNARIATKAAALALGARLMIARHVELLPRVAGGYAWYDIAGAGEPGYLGQHLRPHSAFGALGVSSAYWFSDSWSAAVDLGTRLALDAPRVRIAGSDLSALDRPSFSAGLLLLASVY